MRRGRTLLWAAALLSLLAGCSSSQQPTREELTRRYQEAITAHGGEMVEYNPVITEFDPEDTRSSLALESLGLEEGDAEAFGISMSMMNTQAYTIAAVMPAQGREDTVKEALQGYVDRQRSNFEFYLPDQYQVAQDARLETLEDGTVLLVMCQDSDQVLTDIRGELEQGDRS